MPVKAHLSVFKDRFMDTAGYILTAKEVLNPYVLLKERGITKREYELIKLILVGNSNKKIASVLAISLRTVETHISNIFIKLGVQSRAELINLCVTLESLCIEP
jgi:DNA-binding CsgD family transcriptional regulator